MANSKSTRRGFLRQTALAGAALPVGGIWGAVSTGLAAEAAKLPAQVVDTHTHFYDPTRPDGVPWPPESSKELYRTTLPEHFRAVAAPTGVTGTIVVEASPRLEDNQWILDLAKEEPWILGLVGNLDPTDPAFGQHLRRFTKNPLFQGIRLRVKDIAPFPAERRLADNLRRLADANLALDLLGGAALIPHAVRIAAAVPTLRIVINHLPFDVSSDPQRLAAIQESLAPLAEQPNIYAKVSNILRREQGKLVPDVAYYEPTLDGIWRLFGPSRVIYGSNWPVSNLAGPYAEVRRVAFEYTARHGQEAVDQYFWKNSQQAYRWQQRS